MRKPLAAVAVSALAAFAVAGFGAPAGAQDPTGTVTVIHGIPDTPVDVYVNGDLTLDDFQPGTVTDPLELPAGDYTISLTAPDAADDSAPILTGDTTLPAGANASIIANLDASGAPALTVFVNDTAPTAAGEGRLVVRHTAAAPAVDVLAGDTPVIEGLENPDEATLSLPAGTVSASVAAAGTTEAVIGPVDVPVVAGQVTIVYAIGSLEDGTLGAAVQTITVGEEAAEETPTTEAPAAPAPEAPANQVPVPNAVPSGDAGIAADGGSSFPVAAAATLALLGLAGIGISTRRLVGARHNG